MRNIFIFIFLLWMMPVYGANDFGSMIPFRLDQISPALNRTTRIELTETKSKKIEIIYSVLENGAVRTSKDQFSKYIVDKLFLKLQIPGVASPADWTSDSDCLISERWKLTFGNSRKEICTNSKLIKSIQDFESSVEIILRK